MDPFIIIGGLLVAGWAIKKSGDLILSRSSDGDGGRSDRSSAESGGLGADSGTAVSGSDGGFGGHGHGGDCGGHGGGDCGGGHGGW
jgi:hypothetical protein